MPSETKTPEQLATTIALAHKIAALGLTANFVDPISVGPVVSVYRFLPTDSTRVSNIEALAACLAVGLGRENVFVKGIPRENSVRIFVTKKKRQWVKWYN